MRDHRRHDSRSVTAAAAAVVLAVAGAVTLTLGLRDDARDATTASSPGAPTADVGPPPAADIAPVAPPELDVAPTPAPAAPSSVPDAATTSTAAVPPAPPELGPVMPASAPVSLTVPRIGVASTTLERLDVGSDGVLPAPTDFALPGWHTRGPHPGQLGPAVIAGHVDGPDGPAVFARLGELVPGDVVEVGREDGTVARFVIDDVGRYAKADFPTSLVYGNTTDRAEIRLITCGGAFDRSTGHYVDNVVAFGHLVG